MKPVISSTHLAAQAYATQARGAQADASRAFGHVSGGVSSGASARAPAGRQAPSVTVEISAEALNAARLDSVRPDIGVRPRILTDAKGHKSDPGQVAQPAPGAGGFASALLAADSSDGVEPSSGRGVGRREAPLVGLGSVAGESAQDSRPGRLIDIRV